MNILFRLIQSESDVVRSVTFSSGNGHIVFKCPCPNHTAFKLCSHSLATALDNELLIPNIQTILSAPDDMRLTPLATSKSSKFAGEKKAKVSRKRKLQTIQTPKKLHDFLRESSEDTANQNWNASPHNGLKVVIQKTNLHARHPCTRPIVKETTNTRSVQAHQHMGKYSKIS